ncbi:KinB sensor domain-containing domain [Pseudomonas sp. MT3]|uniref:KinB sensor domain-containing domain n=1 Tax=Pseudomonas sp. ATCC 13867 TaxID=1294143 RepID=UPI0002C4F2EC|nr:KinB sensor domain-containing domain [Pseudomonas sp. ATCC 13867]AGI26917.1 putative two-component sensor [Pseudomonas sp. ATCC 13867]
MKLHLPLTLRTQLFLSISALMTVALLGLLLGLFSVVLTGREQAELIQRNFDTIEVSQELRQALGDQLVQILSAEPDNERLEAARRHFRDALERGQGRAASDTEQQLLRQIADAHRQFVNASESPGPGRPELLDDNDLSRNLDELRQQLLALHEFAMRNIDTQESDARTRTLLISGLLGLVGVAILLIGFITAHSIARRFGAPIEALTKAADKIGRGDFDLTLPISPVTEMASLSRRFGLMAEALRVYRETNTEAIGYGRRRLQAVLDSIDDGLVILDRDGRVEHANPVASRQLFSSSDPHGKELGTLLDNPELTQATRRVLAGNLLEETPQDLVVEVGGESRLLTWGMSPVTHDDGRNIGAVMVVRDVTEQRAFERVRNDFVLRASHELRTPVTGMHMAFGLLSERLAFPEGSREHDLITTVDEEMRRLVLLIGDLLNFSRYQSGTQKLDLQPCDIVEILAQARQRFEGQARSQNIAIELETAADVPPINLDRLQIERVIDNLISNALRHTPDGGVIRLQARCHEERVAIAVEDNGDGVPFSQQSRIFEPFVQVGHKKGGAGLGLALCKEIVQLHGGRIVLHSQAGKGSRFYLLLPL